MRPHWATKRLVVLLSVLIGVVVVGAAWRLDAQQPTRPSWDLPDGVKTLQVNGYPMAYLERGAGPPLVLVHGALNDYRAWEPQLASLSSSFRVISVSLRHYYPEPWDGKGEDFSLKVHSDDVAAFIERLGAGPVYLLGHSRGAAIVPGVARAHPRLVRKLVLVEPAIFALLPPTVGAATDDPRIARAKATAARFEKGDIEGGLEYFVDNVNGPGTWQRRPDAQRRVARDNAWTIVGQIRDVDIVSCTDLGDLSMPVLLVGGEKTTQQFKDIQDAVQKCSRSLKRVTIPDAAHTVPRMNPRAFEEAVIKFLSE